MSQGISFYRATLSYSEPAGVHRGSIEYRAEPTPTGYLFGIRKGAARGSWVIGTAPRGEWIGLRVMCETLRDAKDAVRAMARHPQRVAIAEAFCDLRTREYESASSSVAAGKWAARQLAMIKLWRLDASSILDADAGDGAPIMRSSGSSDATRRARKSRPDACPECGASCTSHTGTYCHDCGASLTADPSPIRAREDAEYKAHIEEISRVGRLAMIAPDRRIVTVYGSEEDAHSATLHEGYSIERVYWHEEGATAGWQLYRSIGTLSAPVGDDLARHGAIQTAEGIDVLDYRREDEPEPIDPSHPVAEWVADMAARADARDADPLGDAARERVAVSDYVAMAANDRTVTIEEGAAVVEWVREWAQDCQWQDMAPEDIAEMSPLGLLAAVHRHLGLGMILADVRMSASHDAKVADAAKHPGSVLRESELYEQGRAMAAARHELPEGASLYLVRGYIARLVREDAAGRLAYLSPWQLHYLAETDSLAQLGVSPKLRERAQWLLSSREEDVRLAPTRRPTRSASETKRTADAMPAIMAAAGLDELYADLAGGMPRIVAMQLGAALVSIRDGNADRARAMIRRAAQNARSLT